MWKVLSNPVGGQMIYQVYRIKREDEPMHSGNIETVKLLFYSEEAAQAYADLMNEEKEGTS